jgi:thiol-disulfide isomerase/thioredoxin
MHSIKADMLLLIFGNPDCTACKELLETMNAYHEFADLEASGKLKVTDIFIDRELDAWKAKAATYPKNWINGYDHNFKIREDLIYNVRAIPSLYLLDSSKRVILKDAPVEKVLTFMRQMQR